MACVLTVWGEGGATWFLRLLPPADSGTNTVGAVAIFPGGINKNKFSLRLNLRLLVGAVRRHGYCPDCVSSAIYDPSASLRR